MRAEALMHAGDRCRAVRTETPMRDVIYEMSRKGLGMTCVTSEDERWPGSSLTATSDVTWARPTSYRRADADVMTPHSGTIPRTHARRGGPGLMEERKISSPYRLDDDAAPGGVLHLHDLWRTEMF